MIEWVYVAPNDFFDLRIFCGLDSYDAHMKDNRIVRCPGSGCELCASGLRSFCRTIFGVIDRRDGKCKAWAVGNALLNELSTDPNLQEVRVLRASATFPGSSRVTAIPLARKKRLAKKEERMTQDFREKYNAMAKKSTNNPA